MKNKEKYKDELVKILSDHIAIDKDTGVPIDCHGFKCQKCMFQYKECDNKADIVEKWLEDEHEIVNWSKVAVDTPILVKDYLNTPWLKRYFARFENGKVYTFDDGRTSWSVVNDNELSSWKYAKLAESEESHGTTD